MRLWSLHPRYLDAKGLVALWREGLLAQAVIAGRTRGYRHHPQLDRFRAGAAAAIAAYLEAVHAEAVRRAYRFDAARIGASRGALPLTVTTGQLEYEWAHLAGKLRVRDAVWLARLDVRGLPEPHPSFRVVPGGVEAWEIGAGTRRPADGADRPPAA